MNQILGKDFAGEIVEVGSNVTHLRKGQRILGHALGLATRDPAKSAYPLLSKLTVSPIPESLSFEEASVLPLSISTAATGLYEGTALNMRFLVRQIRD